ncbi:MAG: ATP-binding cassette domain-containing protein [Lentisphaerae bacterium]|jgi:putative ABC transport system ATP-binding protein|nr:ATP-binding cassette domain-containing protein [Lentisphaerota bacterium]
MIEVRDIRKTFFAGTANEVRALRGVSLDIPEGCFVAVIGTNGSGKSTLLNAIAGTFAPDAGEVRIDGRDITRWSESRRARLIGRVFQNPFAGTAAGMTVAENLAIAMRRGQPRGLGIALSRRVRDEMIERVRTLKMGLETRLDNPIGTLSGGQRQALTLLMATWLKPRLLLLDEHTAALDPKSAAQVAELTRQIIRRDKLTALMVTHSMQQAVELPDVIVMMHGGQIVRQVAGAERERVRVPDLLAAFDHVRRREQLDEGVAGVLRAQYR